MSTILSFFKILFNGLSRPYLPIFRQFPPARALTPAGGENLYRQVQGEVVGLFLATASGMPTLNGPSPCG